MNLKREKERRQRRCRMAAKERTKEYSIISELGGSQSGERNRKKRSYGRWEGKTSGGKNEVRGP